MIEIRESTIFANRYFRKKNFNMVLEAIAEIGVASGRNALMMYGMLRPKHMYLVDPYCYVGGNYPPEKTEKECKDNYENAKEHLKGLLNIHFIIKKSHLAVNDVPNELDLVYIDGNHEYHNVSRDIACWYPKIRKGGILCGHDIGVDSVREAVEEKFHEFSESGTDWWIIKTAIV